MRRPRSRRALLASLLPVTAGLTGCFDSRLPESEKPLESGVVPVDAYDCADTERPLPATPSVDDALEPASYPVPSEPLLDDVDQFVREFEAAYRRNAFIEAFGAVTRAFDFRFGTRRTNEIESESDRDAALVSMVYHLETETATGGERPEWATRVTYYVDENIVLRARYDGIADGPKFEPDPRSAGEPVACFN